MIRVRVELGPTIAAALCPSRLFPQGRRLGCGTSPNLSRRRRAKFGSSKRTAAQSRCRVTAGAGLLNTHEATGIERTRPLSLPVSWHCQCPQIAGHTSWQPRRARAGLACRAASAVLVFCALRLASASAAALRSESCPSACTFMVPACTCGRACASAGGGLGGQVGSGLYSRVGRTWSPPLRGSA
jgi:hypothetical protein